MFKKFSVPLSALLCCSVLLGASACTDDSSSQGADLPFPDADLRLDIRTRSSCPDPGDMDNGVTSIAVTNTSGTPVNIYALDGDGKAVQVLERSGPSSTRLWNLSLPAGDYRLSCVFQGRSAIASEEFTIAHSDVSAEDSQRMKVVTDPEISEVTLAHSKEQRKRIPEWVRRDDVLVEQLNGGNREAAKQAWTAAYLNYREFSDAVTEWDAPADEIAPFATGNLTGYHSIERGLWAGEDMAQLAAIGRENNERTHEVTSRLEGFTIFNPDYGLRTHEVMEEVERNDLEGMTDYGAHVTAGTVSSAIVATRSTLRPLRPILEDRGADLGQLDDQLARTDELARKLARKYDHQRASAEWPRADREALAAVVAQLNDLLAPIATMTVIRRTH